jgi:hypothetical protein
VSPYPVREYKKAGAHRAESGGAAGAGEINAALRWRFRPAEPGGGRGRRTGAQGTLGQVRVGSERPVKRVRAPASGAGGRRAAMRPLRVRRAGAPPSRAATEAPERMAARPSRSGGRSASAAGVAPSAAATPAWNAGSIVRGAPAPTFTRTTAGPTASVAEAASEVTNSSPARARRSWIVRILQQTSGGSPRPGMGALGGKCLSCACSPAAMRSPCGTSPCAARFTPAASVRQSDASGGP